MRFLWFSIIVLALLVAGCGETSGRPDASEPGPEAASRTTASSETEATTKSSKATPGSDANPELRTVTIDASNGEKVMVRVELADDFVEQARGLMHRTALAEDRGMLFVYDEEQERSFYMKYTLIPLSIAFMDSEGRIVDIQDMKPLDDDPPHYVSAEPARYALEVNKGFFEDRNIEVGDRAKLPG